MTQTPVSTDADVIHVAREWHDAGHAVVLATVVETWGSAPRRVGSHLAIRRDQLFVGSVSGGCVEGDVVRNALQVLEAGRGRMLEYGVTNEDAWEVGLACGGRIRVWLEPLA
ncbi:MAG: XdhC/CoxI family protein [Deltaproteobacteria bacterium]|nr:XdhC/CoxI family protein [Deltaproteobacteria bacterium]HCH65434.1 XdhC/CoxI family protein [Deltaproteobacteria bacterium]